MGILQIVQCINESFTSTCAGELYKKMVALSQIRTLELDYQYF